jgi:hypothetical protein
VFEADAAEEVTAVIYTKAGVKNIVTAFPDLIGKTNISYADAYCMIITAEFRTAGIAKAGYVVTFLHESAVVEIFTVLTGIAVKTSGAILGIEKIIAGGIFILIALQVFVRVFLAKI